MTADPALPTQPVSPSELRARIGARLDVKVDDDRIDALIDAALAAERDMGYVDVTVVCRSSKCKLEQRHKVKGTAPDSLYAARVLALLADQGKGKPQETRRVTAQVDVTRKVEEWTDEEIDAELARIGSLG